VTFFGGNTASGKADWQIWKVEDAAGNAAYVGDEDTASDAVSNGFTADGFVEYAYDSADRRSTYTYTTIDSVKRLTRVKAETKTGGTWSSPTGVTEVGRVEYGYYGSSQDAGSTYGSNGDLATVTRTTPLSDSGVSDVRRKYYRYWKGEFDDSTNPGHAHAIQYVIESEGYRRADWSDSTFDDDPFTMTENSLKPYAAAYFEYDSSYRIDKVWFNGQCGCGGASDGTHELSYASNGSHPAGSGYDEEWLDRTVVKQPDGLYVSQYFDECGQPLSRVLTDGDPSGSPSGTWATQVIRDGTGSWITEIRTPAANSTYTHSTGSFTASSSAGLINLSSHVGSGDMTGFVSARKFQEEGTGGDTYYLSSTTYTSVTETIGDVTLTRPVIDTVDRYTSKSVTQPIDPEQLTDRDTTAHTSSLAIKEIETKSQAVSTSKNGSGSQTSTTRYMRADGSTAFTETADGIFTYTQYTDGRLTKMIRDCQTNHATDFASGDDPNTDFGITETGDGERWITTYTYDAQGRTDTVTGPDGEVSKVYYTNLADRRLVTIRFPKFIDGTPDTYYGPASYTVTNHAGKVELTGTIAYSGGSTTTAIASHVDETDDDPIMALDTGTLGRISVSVYDETGSRQTERRTYFDTPSSLPGTEGTHYDATFLGYDESGRQWRVKDPTGTITRTVYDDLGRAIERWIGTNDSGFSGGESSGTDNMVKTSVTEYDSGSSGGNSHVTKVTTDADGDWSTTGDQRETSYTRDARRRAIVTINEQPPHVLSKFDNLGRQIATGLYSSSSGLGASSDPTTLATNRLALSQSFYDEKGQVWKTQRHKIDADDGSDDDTLETLTWYDATGRVIKTDGSQLTKTIYDRLGRTTHTFILAADDDTGYSDADDVTGDVVLEERQTVYDDEKRGQVWMSVSISRFHDDYGTGETTGALDTNADGDDLKLTAADLEGRAQITAMWYDTLGRVTDTVAFGTYGGSDFDRDGMSVPARSDTALRTTTAYNDDGSRKSVTDPMGVETRFGYDDAGRQTKTIANYVNGTPSGPTGDDDVHVRYEFTDGLRTKVWTDEDGDGTEDAADQVTLYIYGTTKGTGAGESDIAANNILRAVVYPDSTNTATTPGDIDTDDSDVVSYAYNALGQKIYEKDQAGNVIEHDFDTGGRMTARRVTTLASGFDGAVRRISMAYDDLGRVSTVTQYDNAAVGSGSVVDEVRYTYEDWGNVSKFEQDHDSTVATGGNYLYDVDYAYAKATSGRNTIRATSMDLPDGTTVSFEYLSDANSGGDDGEISRVTRVKVGTTVVATYKYNGVGQLVRTDLSEPDVFTTLAGSSSGSYDKLDRFGRVTSSIWTKDLGTDVDFYDVDVTYDRNSGITLIEDNITGAGSGWDVEYTNDDLNRLTKAEEGSWSGSAITSRTRQELWTLDQVGNFDVTRLDLNGDNDFTDTGEWDDDRTHNVVNELTGRDTDDNGSDDYTLTYDTVGNLTDDGQSYEYVYDAFGRLVEVQKTTDQSTVAEYGYNGLGFRITWHYDADADDDVDANDPTYHFVYDRAWRLVGTYRNADSDPKEQFVYHNSGLDGAGGSSYIDSVILRDSEDYDDWTSEADGTLEDRAYYCQNWRADVSALVDDAGAMLEWAKYGAYGTPFCLSAGDANSDGSVNSSDYLQILSWISGSYDVRGDLDLDGDVDMTDFTAASANAGTYGRGTLSRGDVANRIGYAGYQWDGAIDVLYHVRHRVLHTELGRWTRRDPLGYVDGQNLYGYVGDRAVMAVDAMGMKYELCPYGECPPFSPIPILPPIGPCDRSSGDLMGWCSIECARLNSDPNDPSRRILGVTNCKDGCCVCDREMGFWFGESAASIIAGCSGIHELVHLMHCHLYGTPGNDNCTECIAYLAGIACLKENKFRCDGDPVCIQHIDGMIDNWQASADQRCGWCIKFTLPRVLF
jgi:RHS repeat-associated protein